MSELRSAEPLEGVSVGEWNRQLPEAIMRATSSRRHLPGCKCPVCKVSNEVEMARMLLWFKAQLPPHSLDEWYITVAPDPPARILEDSDTRCTHGASWRSPDSQRVEGYGRCVRCGQRFDLPKSGNALALNEGAIESTVERLKANARREAERSGPCWGDVPSLPRESVYAVLD